VTTTSNPWTSRYDDKLGTYVEPTGFPHTVASLLGLAAVQQAYPAGKDILNSLVSDSGRVVIRANTVIASKKESVMENEVDSLAGATKYTLIQMGRWTTRSCTRKRLSLLH